MAVSHLNGLKVLEACIRAGNFKTAAEELSITPAAVGQHIRILENYLGYKLFVRTKSGAKPTESASLVEDQLTYSLSLLDDVLRQLKAAQPSHQVAITLPSSFAENWFSHRLGNLYQKEAEIDLRLDVTNRMVDMASERIDFAIRYSSSTPEIYDQVELFGDHVLPVCSPSFAKQHERAIRDRSLRDIPLVHLISRTPDPQWPDWDMWANAKGVDGETERSGVRVRQMSSGLQPAISGQGLVLCGIVECFHAIQSGLLVAPFGFKSTYATSYRYRLIQLRTRNFSPIQRSFKAWITECAEAFNNEVTNLLNQE